MPTTPAQQAHYQKNRDRYVGQAKQQRQAIKMFVAEQKSKPCTDCGIQYDWWVMQFDHVRGEKVANIAYLLTRNNKSAIIEEIAKCDVVCANCHANRTYLRSKMRQ